MRERRWSRYVAVALGLLILIGILGGLKFCQISSLIAFGENAKKAGPPPESVGAAVAEEQSWESTLSAVGSIVGVESTAVAAEMAGTVTKIRFESGDVVQRGQVLVELEAGTQRAGVRSAAARRDLARVSAERARKLFAAGAIPKAQVDDAEAQLTSAESELAAQQTGLGHMQVRAPFAGRTGIRAVNVGQYLPPGTQVTTVTAPGDVYVDFTLPQQQLGAIHTGSPVRVTTRDGKATVEGTISAIDPTLDPATRSLRIRATLPGHQDQLRAGMFVTVDVVLPQRANVIAIPATAVVYAPYGNSVFTIEDGKARQHFVVLGQRRGDFIAIARGLPRGARVVTAGAFKLRNGAPVTVVDKVPIEPELHPHPENR